MEEEEEVKEEVDEKQLMEELKEKERRKCEDWLQEMQRLLFPTGSSEESSPSSQSPSPSGSPNSDAKVDPAKVGPSNMELRPHKCEQCQKSFRFKSNLFEHKSLHLGSGHRKPFVCPFCAKTCRLKGNLKKHLQVHVTSVEDLERLWKRSFSRQSGRPRKNAPPAPLPKPGDDLGLVPVFLSQAQLLHPQQPQCTPVQWTFADQ